MFSLSDKLLHIVKIHTETVMHFKMLQRNVKKNYKSPDQNKTTGKLIKIFFCSVFIMFVCN